MNNFLLTSISQSISHVTFMCLHVNASGLSYATGHRTSQHCETTFLLSFRWPVGVPRVHSMPWEMITFQHIWLESFKASWSFISPSLLETLWLVQNCLSDWLWLCWKIQYCYLYLCQLQVSIMIDIFHRNTISPSTMTQIEWVSNTASKNVPLHTSVSEWCTPLSVCLSVCLHISLMSCPLLY